MFNSEQDIANILSRNSPKIKKIFLADQFTFMVWLIFFTGTRKEDIPKLIFKDLVTGKGDLKPEMTLGNKSFTVDPELNQHWVQYQQQYVLNNHVPLSLKQKVFPKYNNVRTIGWDLKKIFDKTRVFMGIRKAGIWNCYLRYRDKERYRVDCYNRVAKFYGLTYREIDGIIKDGIPKGSKAIKYEDARDKWLMIRDNLEYLEKKERPLNAVDYHEFKELVDDLKGVPLNDLPDNYKEFVEKDQVKYAGIFAIMPIP